MALGSTGAMRMGADVNVELGSASTTQISLGQASVRTLIGVASGAVMFPTNFYGKSSGPTIGMFYNAGAGVCRNNTVTRINACGSLIGSETNVGTIRFNLAGTSAGSNGLFFGGTCTTCNCSTNKVTRINSSGSLVGSETNAGTARSQIGGATVGSNAMFYGGGLSGGSTTVTRINSSGSLVGSETNAGMLGISGTAGAAVGSNGIFYGGFAACFATCVYYCGCRVTRINACGSLVGSQTSVGSPRSQTQGGASVGSNGLFYGGGTSTCMSNIVTRINACGALVGSETTAGTARANLAGAKVGSNGVFFGGYRFFYCCAAGQYIFQNGTNITTRINACGALVGSETNVGTIRNQHGSASL